MEGHWKKKKKMFVEYFKVLYQKVTKGNNEN
jgi:hypothetical protein